MAKLTRVFQKQFGVDAGNSDVGVFGSLAAASPQYSKDPETIQSLNAFLTGWAAETIANNRPALEDFNALDFLAFYQLCYLFQSGVPEWDASTTYYTGSIVQNGSGVLYKSLVDDNLNNAVTDGTKWSKMLGTAASLDVGTTANKVVQLDGDGKLPAVDGSLLTGVVLGSAPLGAWVDKSADYGVQQAATDLYVTVVYSCGDMGTGSFYTDGNSNPTTQTAAFSQRSYTVGTTKSMSSFVRKGDYWKAVLSGGSVVGVYQLAIGA